MNRMTLISVAAVLLAISSAKAQTVTIEVEPEQRTVIREYVQRERIPSVRVEERVRIGRRVPAEVELRRVPESWGPRFSRYRYFYADDRVVLVEPDEREVVHIID